MGIPYMPSQGFTVHLVPLSFPAGIREEAYIGRGKGSLSAVLVLERKLMG